MSWFDHLTGGHTHTAFFAVRPADYSIANEGEDNECPPKITEKRFIRNVYFRSSS